MVALLVLLLILALLLNSAAERFLAGRNVSRPAGDPPGPLIDPAPTPGRSNP